MWVNIIILGMISLYIGIRWEKLAFKYLYYERKVHNKECFAGDEIKVTYILENKKLLPLSWIEWGGEIPQITEVVGSEKPGYSGRGRKKHLMMTSLFSFQKIEKQVIYKISKRGVYTFDSSVMTIGDLLGMTQVKKEFNDYQQLVIYPKIERLENLIDFKHKPLGNKSVKSWLLADPIEIKGFREYRPEDSFKMIDWNTTAKTNQFYVKQNEFKAACSVLALLNCSTSEKHWMDQDMNAIESGIEVVAALSNWCNLYRYPMQYMTNAYTLSQEYQDRIDLNYNKNQQKKILRQLASTQAGERIAFSEMLKKFSKNIKQNITLIVLTAWLDDDIKKSLNKLSKNGVKLKVVLLKKDIDVLGILPQIEIVELRRYENVSNS